MQDNKFEVNFLSIFIIVGVMFSLTETLNKVLGKFQYTKSQRLH